MSGLEQGTAVSVWSSVQKSARPPSGVRTVSALIGASLYLSGVGWVPFPFSEPVAAALGGSAIFVLGPGRTQSFGGSGAFVSGFGATTARWRRQSSVLVSPSAMIVLRASYFFGLTMK